MKRRLCKEGIALCLTVVMCMGLAACSRSNVVGSQDGDMGSVEDTGSVEVTGSVEDTGSAGDTGSVSDTGNGGDYGSASDINQSSKENVYSFQELDVLRSDDNVSGMYYQDGKLYLLVDNYWDGFGCYKVNADGSDSSYMELALPEREESYSRIEYTLLTHAGYFYAVESSGYENQYFLHCWDMDGVLQWSKRLDSGDAQEWIYCSQLLDGGEGRALVILSGDKQEAVLYSPQGEESGCWELDRDIFDRTSMIYAGDGGTLQLLLYDEDYTKIFWTSYDLETGALGEQFEPPLNNLYPINKSSGTDLLLLGNMGVYTWSAGDAEPTMLMSFVNSGLSANGINRVQIIDDRHFVALYNDHASWEQKCAYFTYVDPADIPDKEELVLGGMYFDYELKDKVIEFNNGSDKYRITLRDYSEWNTDEDWETVRTRLSSDIMGGQMPDIVMLSDLDSYANYASKGGLADIGALLEEDPELGELKYLQNVWDAYSVDGKLYAVVPSFNVYTMIAKKSLVGEPKSWTMADVQATLADMPAGATAFGDITRGGFIYRMLSFAGRDFVDVESGQCYFDSQNFMDMLEYAATLPREETWEYRDDYDNFLYEESQYRENRTLLYSLFIINLPNSKYQIRGDMGEEISYVGFPSADSNGSILSAGQYSFVISADSAQQEGAWQFVRWFLSPEYQSSAECDDMPVLKSAFLAKAQEGTERPYWIDESGEKQYYDDVWIIDGEEVNVEPFNQDEVDAFCEFIYTVNRTAYYDDQIYDIIMEEAEAFFAGQKDVQEVANNIQSRAQAFVNGNR
ncbi:MAG: extracellular solute-binding protein [Acetatifactor sp.]|nr:extracellular solute-binding protein [Acetatifactor sp.]